MQILTWIDLANTQQQKNRGTSGRFWALKFAIFSWNENVRNIENNEKSPKYYIFVQTE